MKTARRSRENRVGSFLFCLALAVAFSRPVVAASAADSPQPPQNVWLISTRDAACGSNADRSIESIGYWRLTDDNAWAPADAEHFQADDDIAVPTVVFIHGNRTDDDDAVAKGWDAYQTIRSQASGRRFRYVIWSWPADRVCRRTRADVQLKVAYADAEIRRLATWLNHLRPGVKVSLVGHSFGPRIIVGAMHLLAGGQVAGQTLPADTVAAWRGGKRNPVRAVLLAAAIDSDALSPAAADGQALSLLDETLIAVNGRDWALRWYSWLYGRGGPPALGYVGPCGVDDSRKINVVDVSATVGKAHDCQCYCSASNICSQWAHYTFLDDQPAR